MIHSQGKEYKEGEHISDQWFSKELILIPRDHFGNLIGQFCPYDNCGK